jgi:hypothetical protein
VPVFNEARHIASNLDLLIHEAEESFADFEILVVSDGSTDGTNAQVFSFKDPRIRLLISPVNSGKGHAVRRGFQEAKGGLIFFIDGGMEIHPRSLRAFSDLLKENRADIVIGSKRHRQSKVHYPLSRRILSRIYQLFVRGLFGVNFTDTQVGLKLFRREVIAAILPDLRIDRYGFDLEILTLAKLRGFDRVIEAPVQMDYFLRRRRALPLEALHIGRVGLSLLGDTLRLYRRTRKLKETPRTNRWMSAGAVVLLAALTVAYLYPAFTPVIEGQTDRVMSDGTDSATLPYNYGVLREILGERPSELFYGAVPARHLNAPAGFALWIPWSERALALFSSLFVPLEHVSTLYVALIMFLNGLCMFALGRRLGWPRALALGLAIGWAFCPFTRARAQVHAGFAGTYHVPLALLSVLWALHGRPLRAAFGFLAVAMAPHYLVITLAFISPLMVSAGWFLQPPHRARRALAHLAAASVPMILLLGWCYTKPIPQDLIAAGVAAQPPSGRTEGGGPHSFLTRFAAHPVDYFTGDIALGDEDWNPLRAGLSHGVLSTLGNSNAHERANGIRWVVWALAAAGLFYLPRENRRAKAALFVFGAFAFWLSLAPPGPSYWLYSLVSQIRVPSRAGIYVHFAALLFAGLFVRHFRFLALALPLLMIADLPPFLQNMTISKLRPPLESLHGEGCGAGMYYPYVAGNWGMIESYHFLQEMRGTRCDIVNRQWPDEGSEKMYRAMGLSLAVLNSFNAQNPQTVGLLVKTAQCAPLSYIVFDPRTQTAAREAVCAQLGWRMSEARVCKRDPRPLLKNPAECF